MTTATLASIPAASSGAIHKTTELAGRFFLAAIFLISGIGKIGTYSATTGYMASLGVPGALLPGVIALEVLGAVAIVIGWQTRIAALLLAGFTLLAAVLFHHNVADPIQQVMLLKNVAIAGGFLILVANGAGPFSIDCFNSDRRATN